MAARPEPTAIAGAATSAVSTKVQASTRGTDGSAVAPAARDATTTATTAYPAKNSAIAVGTVKSRSPSEIRSASGPWPEIESPTRWPSRHMDQTATAVTPRGTIVTRAPMTVKPEPWPASQTSAPTRMPSRGAPCTPASVANQPTMPTAASTTSGPSAASTPPRVAISTSGRGRAAPARAWSGRVSSDVMARASSPAPVPGSRSHAAGRRSPGEVVRRARLSRTVERS